MRAPASPVFSLLTRRKKCTILQVALLLFLALSVWCYHYISKLLRYDHIKDKNFLEMYKCPACYGNSFCDQFLKGHVEFTSISKYRLLDYFNVKNIYFAKLDNHTDVMLKKLGHPLELTKMEQQICTLSGETETCDFRVAIYKTKYAKSREFTSYTVANISEMMKCPSQRLLSRLIDKYKERHSRQDFPLVERLHLYTTLLINSEPLIMQAFPPEEGWPFPHYYGACGRFIVESYEGKMLDKYHGATWEERIDYSYQLLIMAQHLTDNEIGFSLYWTDVSYDNFVVNKKGKVMYIDLENIIVVDKAKIRREKMAEWDKPHYSEFTPCSFGIGVCLKYSEVDLCSKYTSDHNYYAVCRNVLSTYASDWLVPGGFLHDLPSQIEKDYNIANMVQECANPAKPEGRILVVPKLIDALRQIRLNYL